MARLDGVSKELYPGERSAMLERAAETRRLMELRYPSERDNFRLVEVRHVERMASGFKIIYLTRGFFRG